MNSKLKKIEFLRAIIAGKVDRFDLLAGDGFFIKMGGFYIKDGTRYTEEQFENIQKALDRQGKERTGIDVGESPITRQYIIKYTKEFKG